MNDLDERLKLLRELYNELPEMVCEHPGKCANSCSPIDMSTAEHEQIKQLGVTIPTWTPELAARWEAQEPLHCPALNRDTLLCDVHEHRPMICRLWGSAESMPCPQGCKPTRYLDDVESQKLLLRSYQIGGHRHDDRLVAMEDLIAMLEHPKIGPLMSRFLREGNSPELSLRLQSAINNYRRKKS